MTETLFQLLLIVYGAIFLAGLLLKEALDMGARIEYAEATFPQLAKWVASKKWQRILLIGTLLFYGATLYEILKAPTLCINWPFDPGQTQIGEIIRENRDLKAQLAPLLVKESQTSLRRRTVKLADELEKFNQDRWRNHPPNAANDPNATPEQKAVVRASQLYDQETLDTCKSRFKDRTIGIIEELKTRGLDIGNMDKIVEAQGCLGLWGGDFIKPLRDLAYHLNADDTVEHF
jgi:hypothetical protein